MKTILPWVCELTMSFVAACIINDLQLRRTKLINIFFSYRGGPGLRPIAVVHALLQAVGALFDEKAGILRSCTEEDGIWGLPSMRLACMAQRGLCLYGVIEVVRKGLDNLARRFTCGLS